MCIRVLHLPEIFLSIFFNWYIGRCGLSHIKCAFVGGIASSLLFCLMPSLWVVSPLMFISPVFSVEYAVLLLLLVFNFHICQLLSLRRALGGSVILAGFFSVLMTVSSPPFFALFSHQCIPHYFQQWLCFVFHGESWEIICICPTLSSFLRGRVPLLSFSGTSFLPCPLGSTLPTRCSGLYQHSLSLSVLLSLTSGHLLPTFSPWPFLNISSESLLFCMYIFFWLLF